MVRVLKPTFTLIYEGKDITRDLAPLVQSIQYTDRLDQSAPDLSITVEDPTLLWLGDWLPSIGDTVTLTIQYEDSQEVLNAGRFQFDDLESSGPPNTVRLKFTATDVTKDLRTNKSEEYEDTTLAGIAEAIASRHNLTIVGEIPDISFERQTQSEKTDLEFLSQLASEYGLLVKIENENLIFYSWEELDGAEAIATLSYTPNSPDQSDIRSYRLRYKSRNTYSEATVTSHNPDTNETITATATDDRIATGDSIVDAERAESPQQAEARAKENLRKANAEQCEGSFTLYQGRADAVAGANFNIDGFGTFDGKWQAKETRHELSPKSGWNCQLKLRRVEPLPVG